jgi:hypothetical protein
MGKVRVRLDREFFESLFREGQDLHVRCSEGLPVGSVLTSVAFDSNANDIVLFFSNEDFPYVSAGTPIPEVAVRWTRVPPLVIAED